MVREDVQEPDGWPLLYKPGELLLTAVGHAPNTGHRERNASVWWHGAMSRKETGNSGVVSSFMTSSKYLDFFALIQPKNLRGSVWPDKITKNNLSQQEPLRFKMSVCSCNSPFRRGRERQVD